MLPTVPLSCGFARLTSCSGCQLALLNTTAALVPLAARLQVVGFAMASSAADPGAPLDVALIEGSVSSPEQLSTLLALRRRAGLLVAVGACALSGGVNALATGDREALVAAVYGAPVAAGETFPPQPVSRFVHVDLEIPGCPPEGEELVALFGSLGRGGLPVSPDYPVCMECRQRENLCLLIERHIPCLGPVTRAGCQARCPTFGVACEGCRGLAAEANRGEEFRLLLETGLGEREIHARLGRFEGEEP